MPLDGHEYHGTYVRSGVGENRNKNPYWYAVWSVGSWKVKGDSKYQQCKPFEARTQLYLTPKAWEYSKEKLEVMGFNGNFNAPEYNPKILEKGVTLLCDVTIETDGKEYRDYLFTRWVGVGSKDASADTIRTLNAKWANGRSVPPTPAQTQPAPATAGATTGATEQVEDDDLPF